VEEVKFEVAEFGDAGLEVDGDFLAGLVASGRGDFDLELGGFLEFGGVGEDLENSANHADLGDKNLQFFFVSTCFAYGPDFSS
jgi:hypothetical protein